MFIRKMFVLLASLTVLASPAGSLAGGLVLDTVHISEDFGCSTVEVEFNIPVRYVKHFPFDKGDDLRIQLEPIVTSRVDHSAVYGREKSPIPPNDYTELQEIIYEGNIEGGPYLTLFFRKTMRFAVKQGADFRSLVIIVSGPEITEPCTPVP